MRFLKEVALQVSGEESFWYDFENLLSKNLRSMLQNSSSLLLTYSLFFCPVTITCFVLVMIILTNENDNFNYLLRSMNKYRRSQLSQKLNPSFGKCSIGCVWGCLERLEDRWKMSNMWWNKCLVLIENLLIIPFSGEKHVRLCQRNSWSKMIQPVERRMWERTETLLNFLTFCVHLHNARCSWLL